MRRGKGNGPRGQGKSRPQASTPITAITITIQPPPATPIPQPDPNILAAIRARHSCAGPHLLHALAILHTQPGTNHRARELARALGITGDSALNTFAVALNAAANRGHITKTAPATYTITTDKALTPTPNP